MELSELSAIAAEKLGAVLTEDDFDVAIGYDELRGLGPNDFDLSTDGWSLRVENWPEGTAWMAIDDEPQTGSPGELYREALIAVMPGKVVNALRALLAASDGNVEAALDRSDDPLTIAFRTLLREG